VSWRGSWGSRKLRLPEFLDSRHRKMVRLWTLHAGHLYPPGDIPGTHFCKRASWLQSYFSAGMVKSLKNSNDPIGNRTRVCSCLHTNILYGIGRFSYNLFCVSTRIWSAVFIGRLKVHTTFSGHIALLNFGKYKKFLINLYDFQSFIAAHNSIFCKAD
jgi:hypothetical protein